MNFKLFIDDCLLLCHKTKTSFSNRESGQNQPQNYSCFLVKNRLFLATLFQLKFTLHFVEAIIDKKFEIHSFCNILCEFEDQNWISAKIEWLFKTDTCFLRFCISTDMGQSWWKLCFDFHIHIALPKDQQGGLYSLTLVSPFFMCHMINYLCDFRLSSTPVGPYLIHTRVW